MADFKPSQVSGDLEVTQEVEKVLADGAVSVSTGVQTTIATFTATAGDKNVTKITGAAEFAGEYQVFKNTVLKETLYSGGGGGLNVKFVLQNWGLAAGDIIDVKYTHSYVAKTPTVYGTIWGF